MTRMVVLAVLVLPALPILAFLLTDGDSIAAPLALGLLATLVSAVLAARDGLGAGRFAFLTALACVAGFFLTIAVIFERACGGSTSGAC